VATLTPSNDTNNPAAIAKTCGKSPTTTGSNLDTLSMCVCLGGRKKVEKGWGAEREHRTK